MSYFRDKDFQEKMLMFVCRDRNFLKRMSGLLSDKDFKPRKGEGAIESYYIAQKAFQYWKDYREPIGGMLNTEMLDFIRENKRKISSKGRQKLMDMVEHIRRARDLVAVEAIEKKVIAYKQRQSMARVIRDVIDLQDKGDLTPDRFQRMVRESVKTYDNTLKISHYSDDGAIDKRIKRRERNSDRVFPFLMIEEFDTAHRTFPRGELGLILAKYNTGKSTAAIHLARAHALQGHNVLLFTLEDPAEWVEDRLDSAFSGIKMKKLGYRASKLRRRMRRALAKVRGRIKVIDGTDGGMTVQRMKEIWENLRNQGFRADAIIIDADEGIEPAEHYKGESGERREIQVIYKDLKLFVACDDLWGWVLAQTRRGKSGVRKMIVTGDDAATDISKLRRVAFAIGVGDGPEVYGDDGRYIFIAKHRYDRARFGFPIVGDFPRATFYDQEKTQLALTANVEDSDD